MNSLSFPNEKLENARLEREQEFDSMTHFLTRAMEQEGVEELKQLITDKLAYDSLPRVGSDWWSTPASELVASTLRDVQRILERSTEKKTRNWFRKFRWMWWVFVELVYLAIIFGLFSVASSRFESVVIAVLILIYNRVAGVGLGVFWSVAHLNHAVELIRWEFGRALRLKVPVGPVTEAKKAIGDLAVPNFIHLISIGIGSLIALWHLVIALLD